MYLQEQLYLTKTAASACCQLNPLPKTTTYIKYALRPIPCAIAAGHLAQMPMIKQPKAEAIMVATNPAAKSIPASANMAGLTAIMNASAKKVLIPAIISVFAFVLFSSSSNFFLKNAVLALYRQRFKDRRI